MAQNNDPIGMAMHERGSSPRLFGVLKLLVAFALLALGGLVILFVFDVVSRDLLQDIAIKIVASTAIGLIVATAVGFLSRSK